MPRSGPKRQRKIGIETGGAAAMAVDRISNLPDLLLCHVLSFLPTKQAVATSILSTRWELLWTKVTKLSFNDKGGVIWVDPREKDKGFAPFVDRVLLLSTATSLNTFSLSCSRRNANEVRVDNWIRAAISREVEQLHLIFHDYDPPAGIQLPRALAISKTLVALNLTGQITINEMLTSSSTWRRNRGRGRGSSASAVCFPCLKTLHLNTVKYQSDEAARKLISSCLVLENLIVERSNCDDAVVFIISAPALKHLVYGFKWGCKSRTPHQLEINTPALQCLKLIDYVSLELHVQHSFHLFEAEVLLYKDKSRGSDELYSAAMIRFLESINNVKFLTLWDGMLLSVTLRIADYVWSWCDFKVLPKCLSSCLSAISFCKFRGLEDEVDMIKYFLTHAQILKSVEICKANRHYMEPYREGEEHVSNAIEQIFNYPRASCACEISFHETPNSI